MSNSPKMKRAIKSFFDKLNAMSDEEFEKFLEEHKDGEFAQALEYTGAIDIIHKELMQRIKEKEKKKKKNAKNKK